MGRHVLLHRATPQIQLVWKRIKWEKKEKRKENKGLYQLSTPTSSASFSSQWVIFTQWKYSEYDGNMERADLEGPVSCVVTQMVPAMKQTWECVPATCWGKSLDILQQTQEVKMGLCLAGHLDNPEVNGLNILWSLCPNLATVQSPQLEASSSLWVDQLIM